MQRRRSAAWVVGASLLGLFLGLVVGASPSSADHCGDPSISHETDGSCPTTSTTVAQSTTTTVAPTTTTEQTTTTSTTAPCGTREFPCSVVVTGVDFPGWGVLVAVLSLSAGVTVGSIVWRSR